MNIEKLDQAFIEIIEKKRTLSQLRRGSEAFDTLKQSLEQLEESFEKNYGRFLEEVLFNVYDEYCPDNEVLAPCSYIASEYIVKPIDQEKRYDVPAGAGVAVDADDFPGIKSKLVLVPNPTRLVLQGDFKPFKEVVWSTSPVLES